ncbi:MAG: hypothetical protein ACPGVU_23790 [Limisphaerales bacterium]
MIRCAVIFFASLLLGAPAFRPNIVVFLVDDYDKPETSAYGGKVLTPNLDHLAREGMTFHNAHARSIKTKEWNYISLRYTDDQIEELNGRRGERVAKKLLGLSGGISRAAVEHPYAVAPDQLYHFTTDPEERTNLAMERRQQPQLARMQKLLQQELARFEGRPFGECVPGMNTNPRSASLAVLGKLREYQEAAPFRRERRKRK